MAPRIQLPSLPLPELLSFHRKMEVRHGLSELATVIDFEAFRPTLDELCHYGIVGRPHYDVVQMFKILILQTLYDLSDEDMEFNLVDRRSFQNFVGIGYADDIPDSRTIWSFRERLGGRGIRKLFEKFDNIMQEAGLKYHKGVAIDASFQESEKRRNTKEENEYIKKTKEAPKEWGKNKLAQKDMDATWTYKSKEKHFGYKNHVAVDIKTKLIRKYAVTTASKHDVNLLQGVLPKGAKLVLADSGYMSKKIEERMRKKGGSAWLMQRSGNNRKITDEDCARNKRISHLRVRVEHAFGSIKQYHGDTFRGIGIERCRIKVGLVNLLYNFKRYAFLTLEKARRAKRDNCALLTA